MDVVLVGTEAETPALAAFLAAAGAAPAITAPTLPAVLSPQALVVAPASPRERLEALCRELGARAPVLAISPTPDACDHAAAIDAGADDCIWAGADADALRARLAVLGRRRSAPVAYGGAAADYRALVEGTSDALFLVDVTPDDDFRIRFVNSYHAQLFGRSNAEIAGRLLRDVLAPARFAEVSARYRRVIAGRAPIAVEETLTRDGTQMAVEMRLTPLLAETSGACVGIIGSVRDITGARAAEVAQQRAEERLSAAVAQAPILLSTFDAAGNYTFSRGAALALVGRDADEKVGRHYSEFYSEATSARLALERALHGEGSALDAVLETGETLHLNYTPWYSADRELIGAMVLGVDVTERVRAQEALLRSEAEYRAVVEGTSDGIYVMERGPDGQFRCTVVNDAYQRLLERPAQVVLGKTLSEALPVDSAARIAAHYADAIAARGPVGWEATLPGDDGERTLAVHITPLFDESGECYRIIGNMRDVTAKRRAEDARHGAERFLRSVVDSAPIILVALDGEGRFTFTAGAAVENLGLPPKLAVGRSAFELYQDFPAVVGAIRSALRGQSSAVELESGGHTWDAYYSPFFGTEGAVSGAVGVILDVTDRKAAEATVLVERAFNDATVDSLPGIFYLFTARGRVLKTNRRFQEVSGYSAADVAHMHPLDFFEGEGRKRVETGIVQVFERGEAAVEADFVARDGSRRPYFFTGRRIDFGGEPCLVGMGIDITERQEAEDAARRAAADLTAVFGSVRDQITLVGIDERIISFNRAASRAAQEVIGHPMAIGDHMNDYLLEADRKPFEKHFRRALQGRAATIERSIDIDGRTYWFEHIYTPVRLEDGTIRGVAVVARNVTNRKRSEEMLRESQKLESLGVLAGGIAHDFNNLLVGILGNAGLALEELSPTSPVRETLEDIETAGKRAAELARQMLAYSGKGRFIVELVDLREARRRDDAPAALLDRQARGAAVRFPRQPSRRRGRRHPAPPGRDEPRHQRLRRHRRRTGHDHRDCRRRRRRSHLPRRHLPRARPRRRRLRLPRSRRHRLRHGRPHPGAHLRSLLHHQVHRPRPRPRRRPRHRSRPQGRDQGRKRARRRYDLPASPPGCRRSRSVACRRRPRKVDRPRPRARRR